MNWLDDPTGDGTGEGAGGLGDLIGGLAGGASGAGGVDGILGPLSGSGAEGPGGIGGLFAALVPRVDGMLAGGGLTSVLAGFEANGLGTEAASWVGTGANAPISGADVEKVISRAELSGIARGLGVPESDAAAAVAKVLPELVDRMTPGGTLPPDGEADAARRAEGGAATA